MSGITDVTTVTGHCTCMSYIVALGHMCHEYEYNEAY